MGFLTVWFRPKIVADVSTSEPVLQGDVPELVVRSHGSQEVAFPTLLEKSVEAKRCSISGREVDLGDGRHPGFGQDHPGSEPHR